ncbi:ABC transporter permease [Paenibacillus sp. GCM10023252]|uniref:ABC transporter permease n=1 Tax=Paenibacillus sp. GCM10023252 TaxID=3252649 RepID=UPI003607A3A5
MYLTSYYPRKPVLLSRFLLATSIILAMLLLLLLSKESVMLRQDDSYGPFTLQILPEEGSSQHEPWTEDVLHALAQEDGVESAYAVSTLDRYEDVPIVGVNPDYFSARYGELELNKGRLYEQAGEVIIGAAAAARLKLQIGDELEGAESAYIVTGILPKLNHTDDETVYTRYQPSSMTSILIKPATLYRAQVLMHAYNQMDGIAVHMTSSEASSLLTIMITGTKVIAVLFAALLLWLMMAAILPLLLPRKTAG